MWKIIVFFQTQGYRAQKIAELLMQRKLEMNYQVFSAGKSNRLSCQMPGQGNRKSETTMRTNDESMAIQLHAILLSEGYSLSLSMILRCRKTPGRTFRGSEYCQMVREANKAKCLKWTMKYRHEADGPSRCDETSIELKSHHCFCCRKHQEPPKPKPSSRSM